MASLTSVKLAPMKSALAIAFVLASSVSFAQAPGPGAADLVRTTLPLEGAPKAIPGPYSVKSEPAFGSPGPRPLPSGGARQIPLRGQAAGDGVGRRRLRHQQRALRGLFHDDRLARIPGLIGDVPAR